MADDDRVTFDDAGQRVPFVEPTPDTEPAGPSPWRQALIGIVSVVALLACWAALVWAVMP
jgi:hypothetical protein